MCKIDVTFSTKYGWHIHIMSCNIIILCQNMWFSIRNKCENFRHLAPMIAEKNGHVYNIINYSRKAEEHTLPFKKWNESLPLKYS